jgi:hypothetical protein
MYVIRCLGLADGRSCPTAGLYLKSWDLDVMSMPYGYGQFEWVATKTRAHHFATALEAGETWQQQSSRYPLRSWDQRPNRPLTVFTVEIIEFEETDQ